MKKLMLTLFVMLFAVSMSLAQENKGIINQSDTNQDATITQTDLEDGDATNEAYIDQTGYEDHGSWLDGNRGYIVQDVDEGNFAKIVQNIDNLAMIEQFADDDNRAVIKQDGDDNEAFITQGQVGGSYEANVDENDAQIEQYGDENRGDINQEGNSPAVGNFARVFQGTNSGIAVGNNGDIQQNGSNNDARVWQGHNGTGTDNEADVDQTGTLNTAKVYQGHNGVIAELNESIINQDGTSNDATIRIADETSGTTSSRNYGEIFQTGDFNEGDIVQSGDDHQAWIDQNGDNDLADISQTGDLHTATITQN